MTTLTHLELTHLDSAGHATMVDVGDKAVTTRTAVAAGEVRMAASRERCELTTENSPAT